MTNIEINDKTIKALEAKGFKRWQKGNYDKLYVDAEACRMKSAKTFIDAIPLHTRDFSHE